MKNLNKLIHIYLTHLEPKDKKITVGFSGGADSTALLDLLHIKQDFFTYQLDAVVFTHGDSPIAVQEDDMLIFCKSFCHARKIPLRQIDLNLEKIPRNGWENSGRKARQGYYDTLQTDYVFLGHHQDDQNETTMTQLFRGGGKGTAGMSDNDGFYCRPFLNIHKKDIYAYLEEKNITCIEDPTNTNNNFTRNFWRNVGLPAIEGHYPQYSQILDKFRTKQEELYSLAYDMALEDGLESILQGKIQPIKKLSPVRLKNLLTHIFSSENKSMEDAFYDQQVSHYKANGHLVIQQNGVHLILCKGSIHKPLANELTPERVTVTRKNKLK